MSEHTPHDEADPGRLFTLPALAPSVREALARSPVATWWTTGPALLSVDEAQGVGLGAADLLIIDADHVPGADALAALAARAPVVVCCAAGFAVQDAQALAQRSQWLRWGVQDVLGHDDLATAGGAWRLLAARLRHQQAVLARRAYATDLATGLPHQQQLIEHMSHLLALREREPAPMALLVLRIEGLATAKARLGADAAGTLRRKLAVRLRSALRASDVVASLGTDSFGVLLAWIDSLDDVDGVAAKLAGAVQRPFSMAGQPVAFAVSVGQGRYPDDGKEAGMLLQRAVQQAALLPGVGRAGHANVLERGVASAANDDTV